MLNSLMKCCKLLQRIASLGTPRLCLFHIFMHLYASDHVCVNITIYYRSVLMTDRSHDAREAPLCAEESVAVQASLFIQTTVQHVHPDHIRVHGVWVLPHGSLDHRLPWVTAHKDRTK